MCHQQHEKCFEKADKAAEYVAYAAKLGEVNPDYKVQKVMCKLI